MLLSSISNEQDECGEFLVTPISHYITKTLQIKRTGKTKSIHSILLMDQANNSIPLEGWGSFGEQMCQYFQRNHWYKLSGMKVSKASGLKMMNYEYVTETHQPSGWRFLTSPPSTMQTRIQISESDVAMPLLQECNEVKIHNDDASKKEIPAEVVNMECVACMDKSKTVLLQPCNHLCVCKACSGQVVNCPMCRTKVENRITVYL